MIEGQRCSALLQAVIAVNECRSAVESLLCMVVAHMPSSEDNGVWHSPEDRARLIVDDGGTEWEVYDEASWSIGLALEWDYLPQLENPGLIFVSRLDRRRLWPAPPNWRDMDASALLGLLAQARSIS